MKTNKLRICKLIYEKRQNDTHLATLIDSQILGVVTNLKDTIYCNKTNTRRELNDETVLNNYKYYCKINIKN